MSTTLRSGRLVWAALALGAAAHAQPLPPEARPGDLALTARLDARGDTLRVEGRIVNRSGQTVRVGFGACSLHLLGRRAAPDGSVLDSVVVWETRWAGPPEGDVAIGCPDYLAVATMGPGEERRGAAGTNELATAVPATWVLPDTSAVGLFRVEARFDLARLDPEGADPPDLVADAGTVRLAPGRPPVGAGVVRFGTSFRVVSWGTASGPGGGRRVSARIEATALPHAPSRVVGFDTCAVRVAAFASAEDLAEAPRRRPVASAPAACGQGRPVPRTATDGNPFYVPSDGPVALDPDVALAALGLPPGTWWLGADVRPVGGFFGPAPLGSVWLALGPVTVP